MADTRNMQPQGSDQNRGLAKSAPEGARGMERRRDFEPFTSPFSLMRRFMEDVDDLFGGFGLGRLSSVLPYGERGEMAGWTPRVDVFERNGQLIVRADLPGIKNEDVRVNVEEGMLTISGERRESFERNERGVYQSECTYGSFSRTVPLPEGIEPDKIQANFESGVLEVSMPAPKRREPTGRSIPIGAKSAGSGGVKH